MILCKRNVRSIKTHFHQLQYYNAGKFRMSSYSLSTRGRCFTWLWRSVLTVLENIDSRDPLRSSNVQMNWSEVRMKHQNHGCRTERQTEHVTEELPQPIRGAAEIQLQVTQHTGRWQHFTGNPGTSSATAAESAVSYRSRQKKRSLLIILIDQEVKMAETILSGLLSKIKQVVIFLFSVFCLILV